MVKVYCKNCKWDNWYGGIRCMKDTTKKVKETFCGKEKEEVYLWKKEFNLDGNCPNYKRKWWKFWIK